MRHSEFCYIPMCTQKKSTWFAIRCLDWTMKGAKEQFLAHGEEWKDWKKLGWRIVKVKVSILTSLERET